MKTILITLTIIAAIFVSTYILVKSAAETHLTETITVNH